MIDRIIKGAALGALKIYKAIFSPLFYFLGARCRHEPSCSEYAADAFRKHKPARAFWLSFSRLSRCHPFGSHGFDPVPEETPPVGWRFWRLGDWAWTERGGANGFCERAKPSTREKSDSSACARVTSRAPGAPDQSIH